MKNHTKKAIHLGLGVLCTLGAAHAQDTFIESGNQYIVHRYGIPDFDQYKAAWPLNGVKALPNDGMSYCVPTSVLNNLTYLANHGYPLLGCGPGNWQVSPPTFTSGYNHVTSNQFLMGVLLHTDPEEGTTGSEDLLQGYLDSVYPDKFAVSGLFAKGAWAPKVADGAKAMINGSLVNLSYGYYSTDYYWSDTYHTWMPLYWRAKGHCTTMVGATDWNGEAVVKLHDPGDDSDGLTQSIFTDTISTYNNVNAVFGWWHEPGQSSAKVDGQRTMQELTYAQNDYFKVFLDHLTMITPKYGYSYEDEDIIFITPNDGDDTPFTRRDLGIGQIADVAMNPYGPRDAAISANRNGVFHVNPRTGESEEHIEVSNPKRVVFGEDEELYVLCDRTLNLYGQDGRLLRRTTLPRPLDAISWDQRGQRVVGFSQSGNRFYFFNRDLRSAGNVAAPGIPTSTAACRLHRDDRGNWYVFAKGARTISKVTFDGERPTVSQIAVPASVSNPSGITVDEKGKIFLVANRTIVPLNREGQVDRGSNFFGQPAGDFLEIKRPFANMRPNLRTNPEWRDISPIGFTRG